MGVTSVSFPDRETGRRVRVNGITVNKTTQLVELVAAGGAFHIEDVYPAIDGGRFPVKRIVGETIEVWADIYRHGSDLITAELIWRREDRQAWQRAPMTHHSNDRWTGSFVPDEAGRYVYAIEAWTDEFANWRRCFERKRKAGADISIDAVEGAGLLTRAQAGGHDASAIILRQCEDFLQNGEATALLTEELERAMVEAQFRPDLSRSQLFPLLAERPRARYGAWYGMMPRSQGTAPGRHGTFKDCIARLPDIAAMGFDVVCLAPIHPIGRTGRKGRYGEPTAVDGDPGSPYAVGAPDGGHDAVHPVLGTLEEFRKVVLACHAHGMEVALDLALDCSPDHPWLAEHPQWFKRRADGSMPQAEDVISPDLSCADAPALWNALRDIVLFWVDQGVRSFRIDHPHTRSLRFWEWLIHDVGLHRPGVIFLAETLTRPKLMDGLAKLGFSQSSGGFASRTQKQELEAYLGELTAYPKRDFYRPNFFVGTFDILPFHLQRGEAWMFKSRVASAATLSSSYGIYNGFELLEHEAAPGREEPLDSEKYRIKVRDWDAPGNIKSYIADLNRIRRNNPALQQTRNLHFLSVDEPNVIAFAKESTDRSNTVVAAVALSPEVHEFWLPFGETQVKADDGGRRHVLEVENLMTGERSRLDWGGLHVRIDPAQNPAVLFRCRA